MKATDSQIAQLEEYLETILDLYSEDEYEDLVENIIYQYCKRVFGWEKIFYKTIL